MSMPLLFTPITLRSVTLPNRVALSPLCMYSAKDGLANGFHFSHLTAVARGRAGLIFTEATAVAPEGRITHGCCGLWNDAQIEAYRPIVDAIIGFGSVPAIQIAHAGRKASVQPPWKGSTPLRAEDAAEGSPPWECFGPTSEPVGPGWHAPTAMTEAKIKETVQAFAAAAVRAAKAGFRVLEIHGAHGYLIQAFLSPIANKRNDRYGGDLAGRMRFALEVTEAVRAAWPADLPLFFRISAVDGTAEGWNLDDSVVLAKELKARGVDVVDCSSGGISGGPPKAARPGYGYQVPYARRLRHEAHIATMAVGLIVHADQAEGILQSGDADLVAIGREILYNPNWPTDAARKLGVETAFDAMPPAQSYWLEKRAKSVKDMEPSTYRRGLHQA